VLIVDLDQTIIHTTVDPTVGEWLAEIKEDEKDEAVPEASKEAEAEAEGTSNDAPRDIRSTTPPMPPPKRDKNPNAEALQDVTPFEVPEEWPPGYRGRQAAPRRLYYTKPR
jgi:RNA polymerase II subunit A-like phosphatase